MFFCNVPNSPIGGSFGIDAAAGAPRGEPWAGADQPAHGPEATSILSTCSRATIAEIAKRSKDAA